jgi:hypothetical protein
LLIGIDVVFEEELEDLGLVGINCGKEEVFVGGGWGG